MQPKRNGKGLMRNNGVLPDTCAWIEYFKPGGSPLKLSIEKLLLSDSVFICGPILYELTQGFRSDKERAGVTDALKCLEYVEMSEALWLKAGELSSTLRKTGKTIPFSDILIASIAIDKNLAILTIDKHFAEIEGVNIF